MLALNPLGLQPLSKTPVIPSNLVEAPQVKHSFRFYDKAYVQLDQTVIIPAAYSYSIFMDMIVGTTMDLWGFEDGYTERFQFSSAGNFFLRVAGQNSSTISISTIKSLIPTYDPKKRYLYEIRKTLYVDGSRTKVWLFINGVYCGEFLSYFGTTGEELKFTKLGMAYGPVYWPQGNLFNFHIVSNGSVLYDFRDSINNGLGFSDSVSGVNGTLINYPKNGQTWTPYREYLNKTACTFNGTGYYVSPTLGDLITGAPKIKVLIEDFSFNPDTTQAIFGQSGATFGTRELLLRFNGTGYPLELYVGGIATNLATSAEITTAFGSLSMACSEWGFELEGTTVRLFKDGAVVLTKTISRGTSRINGQLFFLGAQCDSDTVGATTGTSIAPAGASFGKTKVFINNSLVRDANIPTSGNVLVDSVAGNNFTQYGTWSATDSEFFTYAAEPTALIAHEPIETVYIYNTVPSKFQFNVGSTVNIELQDYVVNADTFTILSGVLPTDLEFSNGVIQGYPPYHETKTVTVRCSKGASFVDVVLSFEIGNFAVQFTGQNFFSLSQKIKYNANNFTIRFKLAVKNQSINRYLFSNTTNTYPSNTGPYFYYGKLRLGFGRYEPNWLVNEKVYSIGEICEVEYSSDGVTQTAIIDGVTYTRAVTDSTFWECPVELIGAFYGSSDNYFVNPFIGNLHYLEIISEGQIVLSFDGFNCFDQSLMSSKQENSFKNTKRGIWSKNNINELALIEPDAGYTPARSVLTFDGVNDVVKLRQGFGFDLGLDPYRIRVKSGPNGITLNNGYIFGATKTANDTGLRLNTGGSVDLFWSGAYKYGVATAFIQNNVPFDFTLQHFSNGDWIFVDNLANTVLKTGNYTGSAPYTGVWGLRQFGRSSSAASTYFKGDIELIEIDIPSGNFRWDATYTGEGNILACSDSINNGVLEGFATDNSQWTSYQAEPPTDPGQQVITKVSEGSFFSTSIYELAKAVTLVQESVLVLDQTTTLFKATGQVSQSLVDLQGLTGGTKTLTQASTSAAELAYTLNSVKSVTVTQLSSFELAGAESLSKGSGVTSLSVLNLTSLSSTGKLTIIESESTGVFALGGLTVGQKVLGAGSLGFLELQQTLQGLKAIPSATVSEFVTTGLASVQKVVPIVSQGVSLLTELTEVLAIKAANTLGLFELGSTYFYYRADQELPKRVVSISSFHDTIIKYETSTVSIYGLTTSTTHVKRFNEH